MKMDKESKIDQKSRRNFENQGGNWLKIGNFFIEINFMKEVKIIVKFVENYRKLYKKSLKTDVNLKKLTNN